MKIGIDIRSLQEPFRSGVGNYTAHIVDALLRHDKKNTYILFGNGARRSEISNGSLSQARHVHTRIPNKIFHVASTICGYPRIDEMIKKETGETIDCFFSPNFHFTPLSPSVRRVLTVHDASFELYPEYFSLKRRVWHAAVGTRKQCKQADAIVVPSEHTKRDISRLYGIAEDAISVVYPGVEHEEISVIKKDGQKPYMLFVGTIEPRKNIDGIITGYIESGLCNAGVELRIAGGRGWKSASLMRLIQKTPGVTYFGYVSEEEKAALYAQASICVFPSFYEGFGLPVVEAMAHGIPVLTSDRSSLPEVADGAAYMVNPYNISAIATGMRRLIHEVPLRDRLVRLGKEAASKYRWDVAARGLSAVFSRL